jgi:hypothetical protein
MTHEFENTQDDTMNITEEERREVRNILLHGEWIDEAKQIPLDSVEQEEQLLLLKCINEEEMTEQEIDKLEDTLGRFREALRKFEPAETLKNVEENIQLVKSEKEILRLMDESTQTQTLTMHYPLGNNKFVDIPLLVKNEIDAESLDNLQENLGLLADLSQEELETFRDYQNDKVQTREEQIIAKQVEEKIAETSYKNMADVRTTAIKFLAKQTRIAEDPESTEQGMIQLYEKMTLGPLLALFREVQERTGITNVDTDNLFR